jgi:hypothetical protein
MKSFIRPAWTPVTIAMMIFGFMIFWPLGLAMIAYIVWGDRLDAFKADMNRATDKAGTVFSRSNFATSRTGNVAFDDWREAELKRLHEERLRLDGMRAEFDEYARELRRAKDQKEFDTFMSHRTETVDNEPAAKVAKPSKAKKAGGSGKEAMA